MRYRDFLGRKTSVLCMGSVGLGFDFSQKQTNEILDAYVNLGGNFIDTARVYGDFAGGVCGVSERAIGNWLAARHHREKMILGTKDVYKRQDFGIAQKYGGKCNLRFDDTNPTKEDAEFVDNIQKDISWLGFQWDEVHFASDFFDRLYEIAQGLIRKGVAYVDDQSPEEMRKNRGTLTQPGVNSPWRDRSVEENLDLFERMKNGEFPDGSRVLRAKIDMASPNVLMRDPTIYRILHMHHHKTGDKWCIYPMYDFQHPLQDAIEGVTHSLCSLEYEIHRPLYNWVVEQAGFPAVSYKHLSGITGALSAPTRGKRRCAPWKNGDLSACRCIMCPRRETGRAAARPRARAGKPADPGERAWNFGGTHGRRKKNQGL